MHSELQPSVIEEPVICEIDDSSDDDKPISTIWHSPKLRKSIEKKRHSPKKDKKSKKAKETKEKDPGLGLELRQIGPSANDYHPNDAEAVSSLRSGETVAAFLIQNEAATAPNLAIHQSTRHHLRSHVLDQMKRAETTLAKNRENGVCTKPSELKGMPSFVMDNSYGTPRTNGFHRGLSAIYESLYPKYRIHLDRQFVRNVSTPTVDEMRKKGFEYWNFHREGECHKKTRKKRMT
jgi:hypothetical protein